MDDRGRTDRGLIVLGPKRLPDTGKSLGKGIREFKGALTPGDSRDDERDAAA